MVYDQGIKGVFMRSNKGNGKEENIDTQPLKKPLSRRRTKAEVISTF
jgi:hypothetical protein